MLVEKINSASFANGILRLEVAKTNGRGQWIENGNIEIPGGLVANIIAQISTAATDISGQLKPSETANGNDSTENKKKGKGKSKK
tara:strand:- start:225 stop:479 length:255 start_codon:yes stop_codon:yes gene_type:complete